MHVTDWMVVGVRRERWGPRSSWYGKRPYAKRTLAAIKACSYGFHCLVKERGNEYVDRREAARSLE